MAIRESAERRFREAKRENARRRKRLEQKAKELQRRDEEGARSALDWRRQRRQEYVAYLRQPSKPPPPPKNNNLKPRERQQGPPKGAPEPCKEVGPTEGLREFVRSKRAESKNARNNSFRLEVAAPEGSIRRADGHEEWRAKAATNWKEAKEDAAQKLGEMIGEPAKPWWAELATDEPPSLATQLKDQRTSGLPDSSARRGYAETQQADQSAGDRKPRQQLNGREKGRSERAPQAPWWLKLAEGHDEEEDDGSDQENETESNATGGTTATSAGCKKGKGGSYVRAAEEAKRREEAVQKEREERKRKEERLKEARRRREEKKDLREYGFASSEEQERRENEWLKTRQAVAKASPTDEESAVLASLERLGSGVHSHRAPRSRQQQRRSKEEEDVLASIQRLDTHLSHLHDHQQQPSSSYPEQVPSQADGQSGEIRPPSPESTATAIPSEVPTESESVAAASEPAPCEPTPRRRPPRAAAPARALARERGAMLGKKEMSGNGKRGGDHNLYHHQQQPDAQATRGEVSRPAQEPREQVHCFRPDLLFG